MAMTKKQLALQQQVLRSLYARGPISRIDIAHLTGITPATTSAITADLIAQGIVTEVGEQQEAAPKTGRRKILLEVAPGGAAVLGIELTASSFTFCLTDRKGQVLASTTYKTPRSYDLHFLNPNSLVAKIRLFLAANPQPISAIGVAVPGHYLADRELIVSSNPTWSHFSLHALNQAFAHTPIYYENNVHCMTMAEALIGPDRSGSNFTFFHVARGIFCSTIYNGELYGRENFVNGEIAHIIVNPDGERCDCGRRGCLQTYASHEWLVKKARVLYVTASPSVSYLRQLVSSPDDIHIDTVYAAYRMGDQGVVTILRNAVRSLAATLNTLALVIDTKRIIVHGQLFDQPDLFALLQSDLADNQFQLTSVAPQNVTVKPYGPLDGAIGGAMLAVASQTLGVSESD